MDYVYEPENVCSMEIRFSLEGDVVRNISFTGGCNGNLKAISRLLEGAKFLRSRSVFAASPAADVLPPAPISLQRR